MKHTEIPQNFDWTQLEWCDQLVFAQIKRYMNKDTRTCFPSMAELKDKTKLSLRFLCDSVHRLEEYGLIKVTKRKGTSNLYYFPPETDKFEMFSEEFLDIDMSPKIKEYYMKLQKTLYDKDQEVATTHYNDSELASITGLSKPTIKKYNDALENAGYMKSEITPYKNEAGFNVRELTFDMQKLKQFGLWVKAVTEKVSTHESSIQDLYQKDAEKDKQIANLEREVESLKRQLRWKATKEYSFDEN